MHSRRCRDENGSLFDSSCWGSLRRRSSIGSILSATANSSIADSIANSPGTAPGPRMYVGVPMLRRTRADATRRFGTLYMNGVDSPQSSLKSSRTDVWFRYSWCIDSSLPSRLAPIRKRCWVRGRCPTVSNIDCRVTTSFTARPTSRDDSRREDRVRPRKQLAAGSQSRGVRTTRTFSSHAEHLVEYLAVFMTACEVSVQRDPVAVPCPTVAWSSIGLCTSVGVTYVWSIFTGAGLKRRIRVAALAISLQRFSAARCGSTLCVRRSYRTRTHWRRLAPARSSARRPRRCTARGSAPRRPRMAAASLE